MADQKGYRRGQGLSLIGLIVFVILTLLVFGVRLYVYIDTPITNVAVWLAFFSGLFMLWRFYLGVHASMVDKPRRSLLSERDFTYTICIPCYNEGWAIQRTIECMDLNYPKDKYNVYIINDGSTDDSLKYIEDGVNYLRYRGVECKVFPLKKNIGKRNGLALAIRSTNADIVILVDSDSIIEEDSLMKFGKYFVDPKVGAVSAHADVLNTNDSFIAKMQVARYFVAFRLVKASESLYGTVLCCSGCCSAYRRKYIVNRLNKWTGQTFRGQQTHFSDDRALTNLVLEQGFDTKYADEIQSWTVVPDTLRKFIRQQMRWKRGWLINSLTVAKFIRERPLSAQIMYYGTLLTAAFAAIIVASVFYMALTIEEVGSLLVVVPSSLLVTTLIYGSAYSLFRRDHYWFYGIVWSLLYVTILVWQLPWGLMTLKESGWGTR